jgi:hypothetical protein
LAFEYLQSAVEVNTPSTIACWPSIRTGIQNFRLTSLAGLLRAAAALASKQIHSVALLVADTVSWLPFVAGGTASI